MPNPYRLNQLQNVDCANVCYERAFGRLVTTINDHDADMATRVVADEE